MMLKMILLLPENVSVEHVILSNEIHTMPSGQTLSAARSMCLAGNSQVSDMTIACLLYCCTVSVSVCLEMGFFPCLCPLTLFL